MMKWVILVILTCSSWIVNGQVVGRFYYNKLWALTKKDSAVYFRICIVDTTNQNLTGTVKDFTKDAKLVMSGTYLPGVKHGSFIHYFGNGVKESEGSYENNNRSGLWRYYYPSGVLKSEVQFDSGQLRLLSFRDTTGISWFNSGTGPWTEEYDEPLTSLRITVKGQFKNDLQDGGVLQGSVRSAKISSPGKKAWH